MRIHLLRFSVFCGLTALVPAQVNYSTSPAGFLTTEGATFVTGLSVNDYMASREFGGYPEYRTQIMDSTNKGKALRLLSALDCRLNKTRTTPDSDARSWTNVSLAIGTGDYTKATTTFSTNFTSTPTVVFSSSVSWPAVKSQPYTTWPAPWGVEVSFPFQTNFVQTNVEGTIMEFNFTGGKLINTTTKWDQDNINRYNLDGAWINEAAAGYQFPYGAGSGCFDSAKTSECTSYIYLQTFSKDSFQHADSYRLDRGIFNGGPSTAYARVHSIGRANPPVAFPGVTCNGIGVDLAQMFLLDFVTTNSGGGHRQIQDIPYIAAPPGTRIYFQVAWNDTVTKQLKLARPNYNELAPQPPGLMAVLTQVGTKAAELNQSIQRIPLFRHKF